MSSRELIFSAATVQTLLNEKVSVLQTVQNEVDAIKGIVYPETNSLQVYKLDDSLGTFISVIVDVNDDIPSLKCTKNSSPNINKQTSVNHNAVSVSTNDSTSNDHSTTSITSNEFLIQTVTDGESYSTNINALTIGTTNDTRATFITAAQLHMQFDSDTLVFTAPSQGNVPPLRTYDLTYHGNPLQWGTEIRWVDVLICGVPHRIPAFRVNKGN